MLASNVLTTLLNQRMERTQTIYSVDHVFYAYVFVLQCWKNKILYCISELAIDNNSEREQCGTLKLTETKKCPYAPRAAWETSRFVQIIVMFTVKRTLV